MATPPPIRKPDGQRQKLAEIIDAIEADVAKLKTQQAATRQVVDELVAGRVSAVAAYKSATDALKVHASVVLQTVVRDELPGIVEGALKNQTKILERVDERTERSDAERERRRAAEPTIEALQVELRERALELDRKETELRILKQKADAEHRRSIADANKTEGETESNRYKVRTGFWLVLVGTIMSGLTTLVMIYAQQSSGVQRTSAPPPPIAIPAPPHVESDAGH